MAKLSRAEMRRKNEIADAQNQEKEETIMDDVLNNYEETEKKPVMVEPMGLPERPKEKKIAAYKIGGRPKKYQGECKNIKLVLPLETHNFLQEYGGKYGGVTGYIQHLVDEEINRRSKKNDND